MPPAPPGANISSQRWAGQALTLGGHGPAVDAAPKARRVAVGWGPAWDAVAVLVVVADLEPGRAGQRCQHPGELPPPTGPAAGTLAEEPQNPGHTYPVAIALLPTAFGFKEGGVPALPLEANLQ